MTRQRPLRRMTKSGWRHSCRHLLFSGKRGGRQWPRIRCGLSRQNGAGRLSASGILAFMKADPIIEEVRRIREEYAKRFNYDLRAIAADLRKREQRHPERLVSFPPKPAREKKTA